MIIDATFWVAISFFIFIAVLIYLKIPQKINNSLTNQVNEIKKELDEAEKLKVEAKNLLNKYEDNIDKSKNETKKIILEAKKNSEKFILEKNSTNSSFDNFVYTAMYLIIYLSLLIYRLILLNENLMLLKTIYFIEFF